MSKISLPKWNPCPSHIGLSETRSVYDKGYSTETNLLSVANDILSALDKNKVSLLLLFDTSAAFDSIGRAILLSRP